jgi:hypothetical protein
VIDFSTLEIKVSNSDVDKMATSLDRVTAAASRTEKAVSSVQRGLLQYGDATGATAKIAREIDMMSGAAEKAPQHLGKVERALEGMAFSAAAADPHIAHLTTAVAGLGLDGPEMITALAGLAAVTLLVEHLGEAARKNEEALKKLHETASGLGGLTLGEQEADLGQQDAAALSQIQEAKRQLDELEKTWRSMGGLAEQSGAGLEEHTKKVNALLREQHAAELDRLRIANALNDVQAEELRLTLASQTAHEQIGRADRLRVESARLSLEVAGLAGATDPETLARTRRAMGFSLGDQFTRDMVASFEKAHVPLEKSISDLDRALIDTMRQDFAGFFTELATDGIGAFRHLFEGIRADFAKLVGDLAAEKLMEKLVDKNKAGKVTGLSGAGGAVAGVAIGLTLFDQAATRLQEAARFAEQVAEDFKRLTEALRDYHEQAHNTSNPYAEAVKGAQEAREAAKRGPRCPCAARAGPW